MKRTLPSANVALTPPVCRLRARACHAHRPDAAAVVLVQAGADFVEHDRVRRTVLTTGQRGERVAPIHAEETASMGAGRYDDRVTDGDLPRRRVLRAAGAVGPVL